MLKKVKPPSHLQISYMMQFTCHFQDTVHLSPDKKSSPDTVCPDVLWNSYLYVCTVNKPCKFPNLCGDFVKLNW